MSDGHPWRDEEILNEMYCNEFRTMSEIADELGCTKMTVRNWLKKHDIQIRTKAEYASRRPATHFIDKQGYECWSVDDSVFGVHRLLAICEYGVDRVVGNHVHHKNGIPWDNRPENLDPIEHSDHSKHHAHRIERELEGSRWTTRADSEIGL